LRIGAIDATNSGAVPHDCCEGVTRKSQNMAAKIARRYSDTELEVEFSEHPWRKPIPVRYELKTVKIVGGFQTRLAVVPRFVCPFCLYRSGPGVHRFSTAEAVERHLTEVHPRALDRAREHEQRRDADSEPEGRDREPL
jgi:hypothetical protein